MGSKRANTPTAYEGLARQALDTRYKLADGTELTASKTLMRTDLSNLAWAVIELEKQAKSLLLDRTMLLMRNSALQDKLLGIETPTETAQT